MVMCSLLADVRDTEITNAGSIHYGGDRIISIVHHTTGGLTLLLSIYDRDFTYLEA